MVLIIKPITANLSHDTELFEKMDPYVRISVGADQFRTCICKDGGKKPFWNETFRSNATDMIIRIQVWDDDSVSDDLVGEGTYNLQLLYNKPNMSSENEWVDLFYKGRPAGRILLGLQMQGMNNQYGGNMPMGGQWNNGYSQPMNGGGWGQPPMGGNFAPPMGGNFTPPMGGNFGPMGGGGWGNMPPNNGWGQQPPNNGWGDQPPMGGWGGMPPPNNGWGNNGW